MRFLFKIVTSACGSDFSIFFCDQAFFSFSGALMMMMMMMMKPLFKCHKILVHYSNNWGDSGWAKKKERRTA